MNRLHVNYHNRITLALAGFAAALTLLLGLPLSSTQAQSPTGLRLLQSDANHIILELTVPSYLAREQRVGNALYTSLIIPDLGHTNEPGKPQLPIQGAMVGIPSGAQFSLNVLADENRRDVLASPPLPVPTPQFQFDPRETFPQPLVSSIVPDAATYAAGIYPAEAVRIASTGTLRSQRYLMVEFHPLQYDPSSRQTIFHSRLRVEIVFQYPRGMSSAELGGAVNEGMFETALEKTLLNYAAARNSRTKPSPSGLHAPLRPAYSGSPWYKVAINADGIYQITCAQLAAAGINTASLDLNTLKIWKSGSEIAINTAGQCSSNGYIEFFGQAARTKYTNTNIYWLTFGGSAGKRMTQRDGSGVGTVPTSFTNTLHLEEDHLYRSYIPMQEGADHWYWNFLPGSSQSYADYSFQIPSLAGGALTPTLQVTLYGYTAGGHHTIISVNGNTIDDTTWSGNQPRQVTIPFSQTYLTTGPNSIRVNELGGPFGDIFVNFFDVSYSSGFTATNDALRFRFGSSGTWQYQVTNYGSAGIETFDISDPLNAAIITNTTVTPLPCPCTLGFSATVAATREYFALTPAQRKSPQSIALDTSSNLASPSNGADYIIIASGGFIPNVQPLATWRSSQGMRVKVVDVQDVYDEFSDGLMDAQALRDFLAYAYANWQAPAPSFVLLVGDGNFDYKNNLATGEPNYIPPYLRMVDPWLGETASDNRLVAFNDGIGNTLPQMYIGRLPADSPADVDTMVNKIKSYEQNPPAGAWRNQIALVADRSYDQNGNPDTAGNFWQLSDGIVNDPRYNKAPFLEDRVYYNPCDAVTYPQCTLPYPSYSTVQSQRDAIVAAINQGRLIVNYIGHAGITLWGKDQIFRPTEVNGLSNGNKVPVMLGITCLEGFFHYPGFPGLAEVEVRRAGGGALASWSSTGEGVVAGHDYIDKGFFGAMMSQGVRQLGPLTVLGKTNLWLNGGGANLDLIDTFNLLGDPASSLAAPFVKYLPLTKR